MKKSILALALVASVAAVAAARRALKQAQEDKRAKDQSNR
jgi:Na+-transporting NADH:ubiquinone oxidoreductase subunit NqrC